MDLTSEYSMIKLFDQYYVGLKSQGVDRRLLGFATPYEDNVAGRKRVNTVINWSRGWNRDGKIESKIINNDMIEGFRIADDVRRVYWGGGNVVWRVYDPRGYELEISSANLMRIIDEIGIEKGGVIPGKCKWGRLGSNNILIPENSDLWLKALSDKVKQETIDKNKKKAYTINKANPGDIVVNPKGERFVYIGKYNAIVANRSPNSQGTTKYSNDAGGYYVVVDLAGIGNFYCRALLYRDFKIVGTDGQFENLPDLISKINNKVINLHFAGSSNDTPVAITKSAAKPTLSFDKIETPKFTTEHNHQTLNINGARSYNFFVKYGDRFFNIDARLNAASQSYIGRHSRYHTISDNMLWNHCGFNWDVDSQICKFENDVIVPLVDFYKLSIYLDGERL